MYNTCQDCRVSFLLFPDNIHPNLMSKILNIKPTEKKVKNEYKIGFRGRSIQIKHSSWFLNSDSEVKSFDLQEHLSWIVDQFSHIGNVKAYLEKKLPLVDPHIYNYNNVIIMVIYCTWYAQQDHGGPMLGLNTMREVAELNIEVTLDVYFTYEISTVACFMEAAHILGIGHDLTFRDWMQLLMFIKSLHNIPPSTLGSVYDNGDYRDDQGQYICNIKDYVS